MKACIKECFVAIVITLLIGCSSSRFDQKFAKVRPSHILPSITTSGPPPQLCLALSGGGIRSGAVSLGVLQALYRNGILNNIDYLTTVSGGGYPVYGILLQSSIYNRPLSELLNKNSSFSNSIIKESFFIDTFTIISSAIYTPFWVLAETFPLEIWASSIADLFRWEIAREFKVAQSILTPSYSSAIHRTFSGGASIIARVPLSEVVIPVGFPYPIFLASASEGRSPLINDETYKPSQLFELSPKWVGSDETLYWPQFVKQLSLMDAITSSAAAIDTPNLSNGQEAIIPDWAKKIGFSLGSSFYLPNKSEVFISDGGFIENLGVLPLLRRGCKEIIALDATSDTDLELLGWYELQNTAKQFGLKIDIPQPTTERESEDRSGWRLQSHIYKSTYSNQQTSNNENSIYVLKLGYRGESPEIYNAEINDFMKQSLEQAIWNSKTRCNDKSGLELRCAFPLENTARQSYSLEEFEAYRKLGIHMVEEYIELMENSGN